MAGLFTTMLLAALVALPAAARDVDGFFWSARLATGRTIEIKNVQGSIHAEGGSGDEIQVIARKTGHNDDPSAVNIRVVENTGGFTVCAVNAGDQVNETGCVPGPGRGAVSSDVQVDFIVRIPSGVRLVARTVNGRIDARALHGDLEAYTVNGDVDLSTTGGAQADSVNGSISASLGGEPWDNPARFHTVNGNITVSLPRCLNASVHAHTRFGSVRSDFPVPVRSQSAGASVRGTLGKGGRAMEMVTINGNIRLRRVPAKTV